MQQTAAREYPWRSARAWRLLQVERTVIYKASGKRSVECAYGVTSHSPHTVSPQRLLALNRDHWCVESAHHILDTAFDEDRCRIRTGHGPENTPRLRRFAIGLIRSKSQSVAATLRKLQRNLRLVFDYLKLTRNTLPPRNHATLSGRTDLPWQTFAPPLTLGLIIADIIADIPRPPSLDVLFSPEFTRVKKRCRDLIRVESIKGFDQQNHGESGAVDCGLTLRA